MVYNNKSGVEKKNHKFSQTSESISTCADPKSDWVDRYYEQKRSKLWNYLNCRKEKHDWYTFCKAQVVLVFCFLSG